MSASERNGARVVLALGTGSLAAPALAAAAALAVGLGSGISALFVEDERLLRVAALPFADEIGFPSAQRQRFGLEELERGFRIQAEQLRRIVGATAERLALAWTLEVARGEILSAALARLAPRDLLVVGRGRAGRVAPGGAPGGSGPFRRSRHDRWSSSATSPTRRCARSRRVAPSRASSPPGSRSSSRPPAQRRSRGGAPGPGRGWPSAASPRRISAFPSVTSPALAAVIRAQGAGAVVWPNVPASESLPALAALIEQVSCPVIVLS